MDLLASIPPGGNSPVLTSIQGTSSNESSGTSPVLTSSVQGASSVEGTTPNLTSVVTSVVDGFNTKGTPHLAATEGFVPYDVGYDGSADWDIGGG